MQAGFFLVIALWYTKPHPILRRRTLPQGCLVHLPAYASAVTTVMAASSAISR